MSKEKFPIYEKPLTGEEIDEMQRIVEERLRLDARFRRQYSPIMFKSIREKPLTSEEIDERMRRMVEEHARLDAKVNSLLQNKSS